MVSSLSGLLIRLNFLEMVGYAYRYIYGTFRILTQFKFLKLKSEHPVAWQWNPGAIFVSGQKSQRIVGHLALGAGKSTRKGTNSPRGEVTRQVSWFSSPEHRFMKIFLSDMLFLFQKQKYQHVRVTDRQMGSEDDTELFCLPKNHANIHSDTVSQSQNKRKKLRTGYEWRHGATICLAATITILLLNIIITTVAASRAKNSSFEAEAIFEGDCGRAKYWSTALHVLINIFGTVLLGASNYCMQCLSAPSRQDVDRMHATGKWLDVGTPSIANLRVMKWKQVSLWCLLFLSSLPFHML